jgi:hypothetical protein
MQPKNKNPVQTQYKSTTNKLHMEILLQYAKQNGTPSKSLQKPLLPTHGKTLLQQYSYINI